MEDVLLYCKVNQNPFRIAQHLIAKYANEFRFSEEKEDILEVGCAIGKITRYILYPFVREHMKTYTAVDISSKAIEVAIREHSGENLFYQKMDITEEFLWTKYEQKFGHIFATHVLHLLVKPEIWSANIYKMLKKNGQFFATFLLPEHPMEYVDLALKADKYSPWYKYIENVPNYIINYGPDYEKGIREVFEKVDFRIENLAFHKLTLYFDRIEDYYASILSASTFLKHIPGELRKPFIQDLQNKASKYIELGEDGRYFCHQKTGVILATKV